MSNMPAGACSGNRSLRLKLALLIPLAGVLGVLFWLSTGLNAGEISRLTQLVGYLKMANLAALGICLAGLILKPKMKPESFFLLTSITFGLCYVFAIVPQSAPDEYTHYMSILSDSSMMIHGGMQATDVSYFDFRGLTPNYNTGEALVTWINGLETDLLQDMSWDFPADPLSYPVMYIPQLIAACIVQLAGLNRMWMYLLMYLLNLSMYIPLVYMAIRIIPRGKLSMAFCGLVPMALQQASSVNPDAFTISMSFLVIALLVRAVEGTGRMSVKEMITLAMPAVLLAPAKAIYFIFMLLMVLIPKERFASAKQKWGLIAAVFALGAVLTFGFQMNYISHRAGSTDRSSLIDLAYVLQHPVQVIGMFARTAASGLFPYLEGAVGGQLSGMTLDIMPGYVYSLLLCLLMSGMAPEPGEEPLPFLHRLAYLGTAALTFLALMGTMLLWWTPVGCEIIIGIQGRYLIPMLPLCLLFTAGEQFRVRRSMRLPLEVVFVVLEYLVLNEVIGHFLV